MALTDTVCKNAKCPPERPRLRMADAGGLYLEVLPAGGKHWRWKYRFLGKEKRLAIGTYPAVTLSMARRARDTARETLRAGRDPVQAKKDSKAAELAKADNTFKSVGEAWLEHWKQAKTDRHAQYVKRRLELDVFPAIGRKPIADVNVMDVIDVCRAIEKRGALDIARRAWQTCGQVFAYACTVKGPDGKPLLTRNPAKDVRPDIALKKRTSKHYARLEASELPELLRKIRGYKGTPYTRFALDLVALTFVRTSELIEATWSEFNLDTAEWRIPAARMKMSTPHIVPLSRQAVEVLKCLQELKGLSDYLFPGERDHEKPMSNNTILKALAIMGYKGRMTGHGFRGIASTILHEKGFPHEHIELQLAHQERDDVSAAYNFATYLAQRRGMMQWYADHLDQLRQGAQVIPLRVA
jgi:integrase